MDKPIIVNPLLIWLIVTRILPNQSPTGGATSLNVETPPLVLKGSIDEGPLLDAGSGETLLDSERVAGGAARNQT